MHPMMRHLLHISAVLSCLFFLAFVGKTYAHALDTLLIKEPEFEGSEPRQYRVLGIRVQGLSTIEERDVLARFPIEIGKTLTVPGPELSDAIKRLWRQKLFSDIKVEIEQKTFEGVFLVVTVREYPVLAEIVFEGNRTYSTEDLLKKVQLVRGATLTDQAIESAYQRLKRFYEEEGFLLTDIRYEVKETTGGRATLYFYIRESSYVTIERITWKGNKAFDNWSLNWYLEETKENNWWRNIFGRPRFDRKKFEEDKQKLINNAYRANGYRDARIISDSVYYSEDRTKLFIDITVSEGPKYVIRNVKFEGNTVYPSEFLEAVFGVKKGDVYNQKKLEERLRFSQEGGDISSLYLDRGYLAMRPDLEETVVEGDSVDLRIYISEGNQFRLRHVNIKGNTKTKDHVVRRELYTVPGDLFSRENIIRSVRQLAQLNYFDAEKINPDVQPIPQTEEVDITYELIEKQTDTFNASAGFSAVLGFTGAIGFTFNNFSLQDITRGDAYTPLPHGDGQRLDLQWQFGRFNFNVLSLSFSEPWAFGTPTTLGFSIFDQRQNFGFEFQQTGASLSIGRRLTWPDDYFRIDYTLRYQLNRGGFIQIANQPSVADEFSIIQVISRNSLDNPIFARRGSDVSLSTQISGGPFLPGTVDFYKFVFKNQWFAPIVGNLVFMFNSEFGYLGRFNESDFVFPQNFFFMGGSGISFIPTIPLRGYLDQTIGNFEQGLQIPTGNVYSKFTAEIRYPISLNPQATVFALLFAEGGNVWRRFGDVNLADLKRSVGVGVRLFLPIIGLVGLDYGFGFDPVIARPGQANQGWNFIFTFGQFAR
ncbi:MAG: outer membrane protein assembly factor BamA [[Chlorobium] sp. 445]|nr:MAG: outer membrane protein assembly factor BamA [[Chlorobium] sp. 445]